MTSPFADFARFYRKLEELDLRCLVVGSVAAMHYGEPRATIDIDLVVNAGPDDAPRIAAAFRDERYYVPPVAVIRRELGRAGGSFNIIDSDTGLKADCYTAGRDELGRYQLEHAVAGRLGDEDVLFAPAAGIIAMKLLYHGLSGQDKHLRDIRAMLVTSPEAIDRAFLDRWAGEQGLAQTWRVCQDRAGEE